MQSRDLIDAPACVYRDLDARSRYTKSARKIAGYVLSKFSSWLATISIILRLLIRKITIISINIIFLLIVTIVIIINTRQNRNRRESRPRSAI